MTDAMFAALEREIDKLTMLVSTGFSSPDAVEVIAASDYEIVSCSPASLPDVTMVRYFDRKAGYYCSLLLSHDFIRQVIDLPLAIRLNVDWACQQGLARRDQQEETPDATS